MKCSLSFLFILIFQINLFCTPINFVSNLETAIKLAQEQNKLIFVDVMADWCKPCKQMIADIEGDETVVGFFNTHFINLQINEKYQKSLISKYSIEAYPTLLFLDHQGLEIERYKGYGGLNWLHQNAIKIDNNNTGLNIDLKNDIEFDEAKFVLQLTKLIKEAPAGYAEKKIKSLVEMGPPYDITIMHNFESYLDFKTFKRIYTKMNGKNDTLLSEKMLVCYLMEDNHYMNTRILQDDSQMLSELTGLIPLKILTYMMAFQAVNLPNPTVEQPKANILVHCKSLLKTYPETKDINLLFSAFIEVIKVEKDTSYYKSILPIFSSIYSTSPIVEHHDMLSVVYYLLGQKTESVTEVVKANSLAFEQKVKYKPLLNFYRELFESSNNIKTGN